MERFQERPRAGLPDLPPLVGWTATDLPLNRVQSRDPLQSFLGHRRLVSDVKIVELPSDVRPTRRLANASGFIDLVEPRVPVGLQRAREVAQVTLGMLALAIGRVREPHPRRRGVPGGPVVTNIGPQSARFRSSQAGCQYRHRGVVGVQLRRTHHVTP